MRFAFLLIILIFTYEINVYCNESEDVVDIAIIGAGVSGNYCAYRLITNDPMQNISLFEASDRIGGRLFSMHLKEIPHIPVELGGMRYLSTHSRVIDLVDELKIPTELFSKEGSDNIYHLRGKIFRESQIKEVGLLPYALTEKEKKFTPWQLLLHALRPLIPEIETLSLEKWTQERDSLTWKGQPLFQVSFQEYLAENLSEEGFQLLIDLGYVQMIAQVSIYTQLGSFLEHSIESRKLTDGYDRLPKKLAELSQKKGVTYQFNHELIEINQDSQGVYELYFRNKERVKAKQIILTCTPPALKKLWESSKVLQSLVSLSAIDVHLPNPLTKLFFVYSKSWWEQLSLFSGSSLTTLPLRSTFYLGVEEEQPMGEKGNNNALLLASYQGSYTPFWESSAKKYAFEKKRENPYVPGDVAIRSAQNYLKQEHGLQEIPEPIAALFIQWMQPPHYGAYFFWQIGIIPEKWIVEFMELGQDSHIFLAGSPYSTHTGWVEGALESCDLLLNKKFGISKTLLH